MSVPVKWNGSWAPIQEAIEDGRTLAEKSWNGEKVAACHMNPNSFLAFIRYLGRVAQCGRLTVEDQDERGKCHIKLVSPADIGSISVDGMVVTPSAEIAAQRCTLYSVEGRIMAEVELGA